MGYKYAHQRISILIRACFLANVRFFRHKKNHPDSE